MLMPSYLSILAEERKRERKRNYLAPMFNRPVGMTVTTIGRCIVAGTVVVHTLETGP